MNRTRIITVLLIILAAAAERVIVKETGLTGGMWNFAPVGAMCLFGGVMFGRKWFAFLLPLVVLLLSDLYMAMGSDTYADYLKNGDFISVYGTFMLITLFGTLFSKKVKVLNVALASVAGSVIFFIVSNFFVWIGVGAEAYSQDLQGLLLCYERAIPFFKNTLVSDLVFNTLLFGTYYLLSLRIPSLKEAWQKA